MRSSQHENIIAVRDIMRPPSKEAFNDVYIVYEASCVAWGAQPCLWWNKALCQCLPLQLIGGD